MTILRCEECGEGMRQVGFETVTLVGYYSEPGHDHDDNCRSRTYRCTVCGYEERVSVRNACPARGCGWKGKETCFCHQGRKLEAWPTESP